MRALVVVDVLAGGVLRVLPGVRGIDGDGDGVLGSLFLGGGDRLRLMRDTANLCSGVAIGSPCWMRNML